MPQITLTGAPAERRRVVDALQEFCREHAISPQVEFAADLALEEHITNILTHGGATKVVIGYEVEADFFVISVEDNGKAFDPLTAPRPNIDISLKEKPVGGLGIHLMREFMNELSYFPNAPTNVLTMKKRLSAEPL